MLLRTWAIFVIALFIGSSCSGVKLIDTTAGKGQESPVPEDAKDDSFRKPTMHGELAFGLKASAELTEDERFHAWTFVLGDTAQVALQTELITPNVDTVLYLYRWHVEAKKWGAYKYRNDDYEDTVLWSRLDRELTAGKYRVLVKGFKRSIHGDFGLNGSCEGPGCPGDAAPAEIAELPFETNFSLDCAQAIQLVLDSDVLSKDDRSVVWETDRSMLPEATRIGVDLYRSYWLEAWDDTVDDQTGDHVLQVETIELRAGVLVTAAFEFADEVTVTFLLDADHRVLALYHDEQSPTVSWFCAESAETLAAPDEWCAAAWLRNSPHTVDEETSEQATSTPEAANESLQPQVAHAVALYVDAAAPAPNAELSIEVVSWDSADWGAGARVTVSSEAGPTVEYLTADTHFGATWVLKAVTEQSTSFVCDEAF